MLPFAYEAVGRDRRTSESMDIHGKALSQAARNAEAIKDVLE